jgi:hypothetical protein
MEEHGGARGRLEAQLSVLQRGVKHLLQGGGEDSYIWTLKTLNSVGRSKAGVVSAGPKGCGLESRWTQQGGPPGGLPEGSRSQRPPAAPRVKAEVVSPDES